METFVEVISLQFYALNKFDVKITYKRLKIVIEKRFILFRPWTKPMRLIWSGSQNREFSINYPIIFSLYEKVWLACLSTVFKLVTDKKWLISPTSLRSSSISIRILRIITRAKILYVFRIQNTYLLLKIHVSVDLRYKINGETNSLNFLKVCITRSIIFLQHA